MSSGQGGKEGGAVGAGVMQAVQAAVMAGGALEGHQIGDVLGNLDLLALVPAAGMSGDDLGAVDHPHALERGMHYQHAAHVAVRHRVVVQVEAHAGGARDPDLFAFFARKRIVRQSQQSPAFLGEHLAYAPGAVFGAGAFGGDALAPAGCLQVQIAEVGEAARGKEAVADMTDGPLDAPFFIAAGHATGRGSKR